MHDRRAQVFRLTERKEEKKMQEKYIPLYKDLYTTFDLDDKQGHMLAIARLATDIAQDIMDSVTLTPLSASAIITACKFVIKIISENPAVASSELDAFTDVMLAVVAMNSTVYSGTKTNKSFEEMVK
jgi:hypothetical protein|nr:MAG TPA: hypothetical protein [Caudoviricetes sp.]